MADARDLNGRRIVVTGASSGLGAGIARVLAAHGAGLVLVGRNMDRLNETKNDLQGVGHLAKSIDLLDSDGVPQRLREIADEFGALDGVVHSAGVMALRPLKSLVAPDWDVALKTNVVAAGALAKGFRQPGVNRQGGSIVFISSVTGLVGHSAQSLYSATKGALIALARSLAVELARDKIRVNCIAPAVVETGMSEKLKSGMTPEQWAHTASLHPLGLGRAEDVGHAVSFLLADTGRWITGTTLVVDGGYTAQ